MEQSRTLMTAEINFIGESLSLIHVPLRVYPLYVQPTLQLLYPAPHDTARDTDGQGHNLDHGPNGVVNDRTPWTKSHAFLNISITPIECSIVCSKTLADEYFKPLLCTLPEKDQASISSEEYVAVSVEGEGLEAGQRVLELTSPLAMAGMSKSQTSVIRALKERGFVLSKSSDTYVNVSASHGRNASSSSLSQALDSPSTPPPASLPELQARTFSLLSRHKILPQVHRKLRLLHVAGRGNHADANELQNGVTKCIIHPPKVFSLTLTETEDPSLLIDSDALPMFGSDQNSILLGARDDYLIPITLNLEPLPLEATGIVCGVSGRLVSTGTSNGGTMDAVEMRYLSTARGAAVIVDEEDLDRAVELLSQGEGGLDVTELG